MLGQRRPHGAAVGWVGQDAAGQDQQVVEAELSEAPAPVGGRHGAPTQDLDESVEDLVDEPLDLAPDVVADLPQPFAHVVDRHRPRPVLLVAGPGRAVGDGLGGVVAEEADDRQRVVGGGLEGVGEPLHVVEAVEHRVGVGGAVVAQVDDLAEFCQQQRGVDRGGFGGGPEAGIDEVPVVVEAVGQAAQLVE